MALTAGGKGGNLGGLYSGTKYGEAEGKTS